MQGVLMGSAPRRDWEEKGQSRTEKASKSHSSEMPGQVPASLDPREAPRVNYTRSSSASSQRSTSQSMAKHAFEGWQMQTPGYLGIPTSYKIQF